MFFVNMAFVSAIYSHIHVVQRMYKNKANNDRFFLKYLGKYKSNEKIQQKMKVDFQTIITKMALLLP